MNIQLSIKKQYPSYNPDGYVFCQETGDPYEPRTYEDLFKRCVRQTGIKGASFHTIDDHKRQSVPLLDDLYAAPPQPPDPQPASKDP